MISNTYIIMSLWPDLDSVVLSYSSNYCRDVPERQRSGHTPTHMIARFPVRSTKSAVGRQVHLTPRRGLSCSADRKLGHEMKWMIWTRHRENLWSRLVPQDNLPSKGPAFRLCKCSGDGSVGDPMREEGHHDAVWSVLSTQHEPETPKRTWIFFFFRTQGPPSLVPAEWYGWNSVELEKAPLAFLTG